MRGFRGLGVRHQPLRRRADRNQVREEDGDHPRDDDLERHRPYRLPQVTDAVNLRRRDEAHGSDRPHQGAARDRRPFPAREQTDHQAFHRQQRPADGCVLIGASDRRREKAVGRPQEHRDGKRQRATEQQQGRHRHGQHVQRQTGESAGDRDRDTTGHHV